MDSRRHREDEILERLWHLHEEGGGAAADLAEHLGEAYDAGVLEGLAGRGLVRLEGEPPRGRLTDAGLPRAERVIRAHRLGERLIHDAFGGDFEPGACELEHTVSLELVDAICTLLGHPRQCPHGLPIPEGECCRQARTVVESPAVPLTELEVGQSGRVVYVRCRDDDVLHRIDGLQLRPGSTVRVHQKYPAFVIECEGANIALDEGVASTICVWRARDRDGTEAAPAGARGGWLARLLGRR